MPGDRSPWQSADSGRDPLRVAVLDADSGFLTVLVNRMDHLGWEHRVFARPVEPRALVAMRVSALIVDLAVLGNQAWPWLQRVCEELPSLGVLVCTGTSTVAQRVRGLDLGADEWITKPCHAEEVLARVRAVVRRRRRAELPVEVHPVVAGELVIRRDLFQVFVGEQSLDLTRREYELIELLSAAEGLVLQREEIYQRIWGYAMARGDRSVDVFVRKLRQKLERASPNWRYVHTHFGVGYRFAPECLDRGPRPIDDHGDDATGEPAESRVPTAA